MHAGLGSACLCAAVVGSIRAVSCCGPGHCLSMFKYLRYLGTHLLIALTIVGLMLGQSFAWLGIAAGVVRSRRIAVEM